MLLNAESYALINAVTHSEIIFIFWAQFPTEFLGILFTVQVPAADITWNGKHRRIKNFQILQNYNVGFLGLLPISSLLT